MQVRLIAVMVADMMVAWVIWCGYGGERSWMLGIDDSFCSSCRVSKYNFESHEWI
jgi:hypothetical protein